MSKVEIHPDYKRAFESYENTMRIAEALRKDLEEFEDNIVITYTYLIEKNNERRVQTQNLCGNIQPKGTRKGFDENDIQESNV